MVSVEPTAFGLLIGSRQSPGTADLCPGSCGARRWGRPASVEGSCIMTTSTGSPAFAVDQGPTPAAAESDGFELDVRIVESGPVAAVLLEDTDNGCDTVQGSQC